MPGKVSAGANRSSNVSILAWGVEALEPEIMAHNPKEPTASKVTEKIKLRISSSNRVLVALQHGLALFQDHFVWSEKRLRSTRRDAGHECHSRLIGIYRSSW